MVVVVVNRVLVEVVQVAMDGGNGLLRDICSLFMPQPNKYDTIELTAL